MKRIVALFLMVFSFTAITCEKDEHEDFKICGTACPASTPWTVESLDQGLPCFATYNDCRTWAIGNGYSDKPCIQCD
ncbi:MAG: hypothetical protein ACKOQ6_05245 [Bacteroidota bacterium]